MNADYAPGGCQPSDQAKPTWAVSSPVGCYRLHPPSPFIIITHPEGWYSFYRSAEGRRLSRPRWLATYRGEFSLSYLSTFTSNATERLVIGAKRNKITSYHKHVASKPMPSTLEANYWWKFKRLSYTDADAKTYRRSFRQSMIFPGVWIRSQRAYVCHTIERSRPSPTSTIMNLEVHASTDRPLSQTKQAE